MSGAPAVLARSLGFDYRSGRRGLDGVDLEVSRGEVIVALGPNGAGKSTLVRLLATDLRPTVGSLELWGLPTPGSLRAVRRRTGYAPDTPAHIDALTGGENARFFSEMGGHPEKAVSTRIDRLFQAFQLEDVRQVPVAEYSFGMKRKLLLIEAFATAPELLLLDEPAVGLDPRGTMALGEEVRRSANEGSTVVIASNETRELPLWADRILFLHRGALIEDAPLSSLLARLQGRTRIEIDLSGPSGWELPSGLLLREIPGVDDVQLDPQGVRVQSALGGQPLPALLEALLSAGAPVRDIRVREPELGDLFRMLTGEALEEETEPPPAVHVGAPR